MGTRSQAEERSPRYQDRTLSAEDEPGRAASVVERAERRYEPGWPAPDRASGNRALRRQFRVVHARQGRLDRPVASIRTQRHQLPTTGSTGYVLCPKLVGLAGSLHFVPDPRRGYLRSWSLLTIGTGTATRTGTLRPRVRTPSRKTIAAVSPSRLARKRVSS